MTDTTTSQPTMVEIVERGIIRIAREEAAIRQKIKTAKTATKSTYFQKKLKVHEKELNQAIALLEIAKKHDTKSTKTPEVVVPQITQLPEYEGAIGKVIGTSLVIGLEE